MANFISSEPHSTYLLIKSVLDVTNESNNYSKMADMLFFVQHLNQSPGGKFVSPDPHFLINLSKQQQQ